jgi:hypothetical protein
MLLKKLYVQNQELAEKLTKANEKITEMDKDHRMLQKQHLLLQHNIQNKIIGTSKVIKCIATRLSQVSQKTLGFRDRESARRNSFDKFLETQGIRDEMSSFWGEIRNTTNNYIPTESMDEELAKKINNVFQSQSIRANTCMDVDDVTRRKETN